ncbi:MAG TPA: hypothetical protein VE890_08525 [Thermoguttaceae bacterium]|nr:hypothetical protein [Thermoguttaceae bacterium]
MAMFGGTRIGLYFAKKEGQRIDAMLDRNRRRLARKGRRIGNERQALEERIEQTEVDLARMLLLAMTVNRVLVRKGVVASGDIGRVAKTLDLMDGTADGKLDPSMLRPPEDCEPTTPAEPEAFFRRLEEES